MATRLEGHWVSLRPVDAPRDAQALFDASHDPRVPELWDYMGNGPYRDADGMRDWLARCHSDPMLMVITARNQSAPGGVAAMMRIKPSAATIEIGHIWFGHQLRHTTAATEALFLLIEHAFSLGNRRVEWKCDALNQASRSAAQRLGFEFEGIFRQHMILKGRNRDTAWYAILDQQWPALRAGYRAYLDESNFEAGQQRRSLGSLLPQPS